MKLSEIIEKYHCKVYTPTILKDKEVNYGFCSDLMSDALMILNSVKNPKILENSIIITGLSTNQSIRTAEMLDVDVVILVRGKMPSVKVVDLAIESHVMLLSTELTMFNLSGALYQDGIKGITYNEQW
ncbi:MAG: transcriptional regulator [Bacillota bacterium]|nr:MAG: transcriptional regulator [Bacillota bacterium]